MQRKVEKFAVLLCLLISLTCAAVPEPDAEQVLLDDGTRGTRILVQGVSSNIVSEGQAIEKCEPWEYLEENGNCYQCFAHDAFCNASKQCCEANMACYRYGYGTDPMCKCDPNYAWDEVNGVCYHAPVPAVLLVTAYTAIAAACIVGVTAILFHVVGAIKRKWRRHRRRAHASRRPQQRQRRLSSMVPQIPAEALPDKPPAYEEIVRIPTVSQSVAHTTGSLRSLPPAYSPTDETSTEVQEITHPEITQSAPSAEVTEQPITSTIIETNPANQGVVNDSFVPDHNV